MNFGAFIIPVFTAIALGIATYLTKLQKGETFDPKKLLRTVVIGVVVGVVSAYKGVEVTADTYQAIVAANAGIIAFLDQGFKVIVRLFRKPAKQ